MSIDTTHATVMSPEMQAPKAHEGGLDGQPASDGTTVYEGEYLEVDAIRR